MTRFRKNAVAVVGDVRAVFMQIQVTSVDQSCLGFFVVDGWRSEQVFKGISVDSALLCLDQFPSVAGYVLRHTAEDNRPQVSAEAVQVVYKNVYVDDVLVSVADSEGAVALVTELDSLLGSAGFELAKLSSNPPEVLEVLLAECMAPSLSEIKLYQDEIPGHKALGLVGLPQPDVLGVQVTDLAHSCTRRGLLSLMMSIFDPLGILSPFLLKLKSLLQRVTKSGLGWAAEIPETERLIWGNF